MSDKKKAKHGGAHGGMELFFDIKDGELRIPVTFGSVSSLFDNYFNSSSSKIPFLALELFDQLNRLFGRVSLTRRMCLDVVVVDMEGYSEEELVAVIEKNLSYYKGNLSREALRISVVSGAMFGAGCLMLVSGYLLTPHVHHVLSDIIYTSGTFFIWDAITRVLEGRQSNTRLHRKYQNLRVKMSAGNAGLVEGRGSAPSPRART